MLSLLRQLRFEAGSILSAFIDLCCAEGGPVEDDDRYIAGVIGVDGRVWRRVRKELIASGYLYERYDDFPSLSAPIADRIVADGIQRLSNARQAGEASAKKAAERRNAAEVKGHSTIVARQVSSSFGTTARDARLHYNDLATTAVERTFERETETQTKKEERRGKMASLGEIIGRSESPAVRESLKVTRRQKLRDNL